MPIHVKICRFMPIHVHCFILNYWIPPIRSVDSCWPRPYYPTPRTRASYARYQSPNLSCVSSSVPLILCNSESPCQIYSASLCLFSSVSLCLYLFLMLRLIVPGILRLWKFILSSVPPPLPLASVPSCIRYFVPLCLRFFTYPYLCSFSQFLHFSLSPDTFCFLAFFISLFGIVLFCPIASTMFCHLFMLLPCHRAAMPLWLRGK